MIHFVPLSNLRLCILLTKALSLKWPTHQIDIDNAFLHETIEESDYMQQPSDFVSYPNLVCKLNLHFPIT